MTTAVIGQLATKSRIGDLEHPSTQDDAI